MTALAALALVCALGGDVERAVAREWEVRRWVLVQVPESAGEVRAALGSADWDRRSLALDALARAAAVGAPLAEGAWVVEEVAATLHDAHGDVRAGALRVLAALGRTDALSAESLATLAGDRRSGVRRELAATLRGDPRAAALERLVALASDPDPAVARAARLSLFDAGTGSGVEVERLRAARAEVWGAVDVPGRDAERLELALAWARGPVDHELAARLESRVPEDGEPRSRDRRAVLAALRARGADPPLDLASAGAWVDGWYADDTLGRQELFAVCARGAGFSAALAFYRAARGADRLAATGVRPAPEGFARDVASGRPFPEDAVFLLLERAVDADGAARVLQWAVDDEWSEPGTREVLSIAGGRLAAWTPRLADAWMDPQRPSELRLAAVDALGKALFDRGDPAAGAALVAHLGDPDAGVAERAFRALCLAPVPGHFADALHRAWRSLDAPERLERLAHTPRDPALRPFRDDCLALGAEPGEGRARAMEHLEVLVGDDGVARAFEAWLAEELSRAADDRGAAARAAALLRGLHRVDPPGAVAPLARAVAAPASAPSVRETAARLLGRTAAGRARLAAAFDALPASRARTEAALALVGEHAPAERVLLAELDAAPGDLQGRMVAALARGSTEAAAFLVDAARDRGALPPGLGSRAVEAVAARAPIDALVALSREGPELEVRRAALLGLGVRGAVDELAALLAELEDSAGKASDPAAEEARALLREAVLVALAASDAERPPVLALGLREPARSAAGQLRARFRGAAQPSVDFRFRGELALAGAFAARCRLAALLDAAGPWWRWDARLLLALSEEAEEEPATALALARAAAVGLVGEEAEPPTAWSAARGRALALARRTGDDRTAATLARGLARDRRALAISDGGWAEVARRLRCSPRELDRVLRELARE